MQMVLSPLPVMITTSWLAIFAAPVMAAYSASNKYLLTYLLTAATEPSVKLISRRLLLNFASSKYHIVLVINVVVLLLLEINFVTAAINVYSVV